VEEGVEWQFCEFAELAGARPEPYPYGKKEFLMELQPSEYC